MTTYSMRRVHWPRLGAALALLALPLAGIAQDHPAGHGAAPRMERPMAHPMERPVERPMERGHGERAVESKPEPFGYRRIQRPSETQVRPNTFDAKRYRHNYAASSTFHIGPYHPPSGWRYRRWYYGETLPAAFWGPQFRISDFWLFGLDIPPAGFEWVRYGNDVLLVNLTTGEVVQTVYDIFL